jgi:glycosyltransferase involved in cell wall biosynthesis
MASIAHVTSAHPRFDTRIFVKMCRTLQASGFQVNLLVADGLGDTVEDNIAIHDVGISRGRRRRILSAPGRLLTKAIAINADIYHLHDPELLPIALELKKLNKVVIFDSHEDIPLQIRTKSYLSAPLRLAFSLFMRYFQAYSCSRLDGVIAATPYIRDKFLHVNPHSIDVNNFPIVEELYSGGSWLQKKSEVCYIGGLERIRGINELCNAMALLRTPTRLNLAGKSCTDFFEDQLQTSPGWKRVNPLGFVDRDGVREVLARSIAGIVTLHPTPNYLNSLPVKMFEYMCAGIPVIASDFPFWRSIIKAHNCGILVDPFKPAQISEAIDYLATHPIQAEEMGRNGHQAITRLYNWSQEAQRLIHFYKSLFQDP